VWRMCKSGFLPLYAGLLLHEVTKDRRWLILKLWEEQFRIDNRGRTIYTGPLGRIV
jgi:hypothetical protein